MGRNGAPGAGRRGEKEKGKWGGEEGEVFGIYSGTRTPSATSPPPYLLLHHPHLPLLSSLLLILIPLPAN
jgi:hypothetical protein